MAGLADVNGFKIFMQVCRVAGIPTPVIWKPVINIT